MHEQLYNKYETKLQYLFKTIRILHECEVLIEIFSQGSLLGHYENMSLQLAAISISGKNDKWIFFLFLLKT